MRRLFILYSAVLLSLIVSAVGSPLKGERTSAESKILQSPLQTLLITEFQYDPPGLDRDREWIELANLGDTPISIGGYGLGDEELFGGGEGMLRFPADSRVEGGRTVIIARGAAGFRALFGFNPDYEMRDTDTAVPDMLLDRQWATGEVALANDGDEILLLDDQNRLVDAVSYGQSRTYFDPALPATLPGQSSERLPAACDSDSAADWQVQPVPAPGQIQLQGDCLQPLGPSPNGRPRLTIGEIQGSGDRSPFHNQEVTFQGVVTGLLEDKNAAGTIYYTLFVQDPPGAADGDPATSDAVAVFTGRLRPPYETGDLVTVKGQVIDYFGLTEIDDRGQDIFAVSSGAELPPPIILDIPSDPLAAESYLESLEGMLVQTTAGLPVIGATHSGCGFALNADPDSKRPLRRGDDDRLSPAVLVLNQSDVDCTNLPALKSRDLVGGVRGPLTYHFERYKIVQQDPAALQIDPAPLNTPPALPPIGDGELRVATLNLEDFLDTEVEGETLASKTNKLALTISSTLGCPQIIGVQEVGSALLLLQLAEASAEYCGFLYQVSHLDSADVRGIDVALLSDPRTVAVESLTLRQTCSPLPTAITDNSIRCPPGEEPLFSRPPLQVALRVSGEQFTVLVNHFKSKRGGAVDTAPRRIAQAAHVHELVKQQLASNPEAAVIVLGDFNDYDQSAAWQGMQDGGVLYDVMQRVAAEERYTFVFDGEAQLIDGILVSPALVHRIAAVTIPHINADFPSAWAADRAYIDMPYHSSDHDPVLLTLEPAQQAQSAARSAAPTPQPKEIPAEDTAAPSADNLPPPTAEPAAAGENLPPPGSGTIGSLLPYVLSALLLLFALAGYAVFKKRG